MPGSKSDYLEALVLDLLIGAVASGWTRPAGLNTLYIAAFPVAPSDAGGGTEISTGGGSNYGRVAVTNNDTYWGRTDNQAENLSDISFPTALTDWGTVVAIGIFDAATSGNLLWWCTLATSKEVLTNDILVITAGDLVITED